MGRGSGHLGNSSLFFITVLLDMCPSLARVSLDKKHVMKVFYALLWRPPDSGYTTTKDLQAQTLISGI